MVGVSAEEKILKLLKGNEGLTTSKIQELMLQDPQTDLEDVMSAINKLLQNHRVVAFTLQDTGEVLLREQSKEMAVKFKGLTAEDVLIYELIKGSGSMGLWTRDMKTRTNLQTAQVTKILKTLEARKLVKSVRAAANGNKKVYILFEEEPSKEITGGAWYTEAEFDVEFIKVLREACLRYIIKEGEVTLDDVRQFVTDRKLSKVDLRSEDVYTILYTLQLDNLIESIEHIIDDEEVEYFRESKAKAPTSVALTAVPCGTCPVIHECTPGGVISPETCEYYQTYLDF